MNAKILLLVVSAVAFTSCSTVYKSGQTPDDVYYSPVRPADESRREEKNNDQVNTAPTTSEEQRMRMTIRDRRWRDLDYDYDYSYGYNYSPYNYCFSGYNNYGYYYNPYYYSMPLYSPRTEVNTTPRMVNLNTYKNYTSAVTSTNPKTGAVTTSFQPGRQYNNSNNSGSRLGNAVRQIFTPSQSNSTNTNSSSNNNTRTYTPSSSSSSSSSSSGSSSSGSSVSRPSRGGN